MSGFYTDSPECQYIVASAGESSSIEIFSSLGDAHDRAMDLARETGLEYGAYRADTLYTWTEGVKL